MNKNKKDASTKSATVQEETKEHVTEETQEQVQEETKEQVTEETQEQVQEETKEQTKLQEKTTKQVRETMQPYFDSNPHINVFHVASDNMPFYSKEDAKMHQKALDKEKEVLTINR